MNRAATYLMMAATVALIVFDVLLVSGVRP